MTDFELAVKYKPYIRFDQKEPFEITAVAYTVFIKDSQSKSFPKRRIVADWNEIEYVIEYAIWFDYDITHLYELEHLWIYVDKEGRVKEAEGSFHGKILRMVLPDTGQPLVEEENHLVVYSQPGKHAFLPEIRLFHLVPDLMKSCNEYAGIDGIAVPECYQCHFDIENETVVQYIRNKYRFTPTMNFVRRIWKDTILMTWEKLASTIPNRINAQVELMRIERGEVTNG
ncbi:MAG: hypothetical protein JW708_01660 [Vallitaleaceae bacterium]|nr:hypothetical protein [Vallitaleaceae bacterium]